MAEHRNERADQKEKPKVNVKSLKRLQDLFRFIRPYVRYFIAGMACLLLSNLTLLSFPYLVGKLIDTATGNADWILASLESIALALLGILLVQGVFSFFRVYLFAVTSERSVADIRKALFRKFMFLPLAFYDENRSGELMSRITADVTLLHDTMSLTLAEFIRQVATLLIGTIIIFITVPRLTVFMLAIFPVVIILAVLFGRYIRKLSRKTQDSLATTNIIVDETLQAIRDVKSFTNELREIGRYGNSMVEVIRIALKTAVYRGGFISFIIFALFGTIVAVIWYGASLVSAGQISVGDLLSFVLYTTFIGGSIAGLGDVYSRLQKTVGASERVLDILEEEEESGETIRRKGKVFERATTGKGDTTREGDFSVKGDIAFKGVHFSYPTRKDHKVLKGIDLYIREGEKIALVGQSGAGKSTVVQLLLRFYSPGMGSIRINDIPIEEIDLYDYRSRIAIVPQEVILFGGTIKENILYGDPEADDTEVLEAAEKANALAFINEFPEKMDTKVGERGVKLSGGQKQRIAIARAILRDPDILILDEATSSLDSNSESLVKEALDKLMVDRTTIIIAHRLATIRKVDNIYVIQQGKIVEKGSHQELLESSEGIYSNLVKMQISHSL